MAHKTLHPLAIDSLIIELRRNKVIIDSDGMAINLVTEKQP